MPDDLALGFFAFGAVLILISLLGGGFNIFSFGVSTTISNPLVRVTAFLLGMISIVMAINPGISSIPRVLAATDVPAPTVTDAPPSTAPSTQASVQAPEPSPQPSHTATVPTEVPVTPTFSRANPVDFVISYWQNVNDGRFENAWFQLSPGFRQARHNDNYADYLQGYQQMDLCSITLSDIHVTRQEDYFSVVEAHFTYYTGAECRSSEYNFEMWLVYDIASQSWLFDKNILKQ